MGNINPLPMRGQRLSGRSSELITSSGCVCAKDPDDFIANPAKLLQHLRLRASCIRRIVEPPMVAIQLPWKIRARLIRVAAHGNDGFHIPIQKIVHVLRLMSGDIDVDFLESLNGLGVHKPGRLGTGALNIKKIAGGMAKNAFRHVTATGIAGAKNENGRFCIE